MKKVINGLVVSTMLLPATAFAALSVDQQAAADAIEGMITDWSAWAWGAVILLMGSLIGIKLAKKFFRAGT